MSHEPRDEAKLLASHNTARYFVENRHISWVLLAAVMLWGVYGYLHMPQRKDPDIPVREAVALCPWPGIPSEKVEQLVTRKIEQAISANDEVDRIEATTRTGLSVVKVKLQDDLDSTGETFDDINNKLMAIAGLPEGAGPVQFIKDFGDTATLMLTVASPPVSEVEVDLRARDAEKAIRELRGDAQEPRVSVVVVYPETSALSLIRRKAELLREYLLAQGLAEDVRVSAGPWLAVFDMRTTLSDAEVLNNLRVFANNRLRASEFSPDMWFPALVHDPAETRAKLGAVAGNRYTYKQLEDFTETIQRTLLTLPIVSKISRWGVVNETVYLEYSQPRLAAYGLNPWDLQNVLAARNIALPGGIIEAQGKNLLINPSGEFKNASELASAVITVSKNGAPVYLRDIVDINRDYENPKTNLNYHVWRDPKGEWQRCRAITLAINMRSGEQIADFSEQVDGVLAGLKARLPDDLILARTSDQPRQVVEKIDLFMDSIYEAIALVVIVAFIGFREWRSALLMAMSIPITLAMTFGMMHLVGIDLQQVSLAALIIALGLLVDDPVVANDAIKHELRAGKPADVAAWLGPVKLAKAIMYATVTNIVAYLPYLMLQGDKGRFLYSLPIVVTCALIASRIVSMTFIPLIGRSLLRPGRNEAASMEEMRSRGFFKYYSRLVSFCIDHRWKTLAASLVIVVAGFWMQSKLNPQYFPNDLSYLFYLDVWLPEDAPVSATDQVTRQVEAVVREAAAEYGKTIGKPGKPADVLTSVTSFVGGGGPRFWFSVSPELSQPNYAQVLVEVKDNHYTGGLIPPLQEALSAKIVGARVDTRKLETGSPIGIPVQIRIYGEDMRALRQNAEKLKTLLRAAPYGERIQDNWGAEIFRVRLDIDSDKANMAGVTNMDVAQSSAAAMNGFEVTTLREGRLTIPIRARLRMEERAGIEDVQSVYVTSEATGSHVPLHQISRLEYGMESEKIFRRNQFRCIIPACFPQQGALASQVMANINPILPQFEKELPPGFRLEVGGEQYEQVKGFGEMTLVLLISVAAIYLALLMQFKNAVKPLIVFAAIPYGMSGAFAVLYATYSPFGFMAYLGIVSLIGVIVSHIIVLFDFIEERRAEGDDLRMALIDAGVMRLRPVLITVGATVTALFPLSWHGGPLWEPLCYAQIGGLLIATMTTLLMVPTLYAIAAFDLKVVD
ncbi:efflux RND transporter permease subunit [Desulfovibrio aminophilus]|uniref:efflux RND transporter permease subunit n=1 Tax=Desulfovibrio aminophilus TaxID=81425 RepID=UPI0004086F71|nr:efflux RND transporter permease subunit [Desulfovibrio aminophilus]